MPPAMTDGSKKPMSNRVKKFQELHFMDISKMVRGFSFWFSLKRVEVKK